jgi:ribokinase
LVTNDVAALCTRVAIVQNTSPLHRRQELEQSPVANRHPPTITVVGSSNTDLVVRVAALPRPGETVLGGDVRQVAGGKGANQAVAARRLGATVYFVGCVGADSFGVEAAACLAREGLRVEYLRRIPDAPSGVALIAVAANGENSIVVAPGANRRLSARDIEHASPALRSAHVVVAQLEIPIAAVRHAFALARSAGVTTLLNAAPAQPEADDLLNLVDVLVCNTPEAQALTGSSASTARGAEVAARQLMQRGPPVVIVTRGDAGCVLAERDQLTHIPAFDVPAVDSTAAGDAFTGALAVLIASGDVPRDAVRYASAAAAISVQREGAQPSLPTAEEVERFLALQAP